MNDIVTPVILMLCYSGVFLFAEALFLFTHSREISRKVAHVLGAGVTMLLPLYGSLFLAVLFGVVFTVFIMTARYYGFIRSIREEPFAYGSVLFPIGLTLACLIFWNDPAALVIGILIFGMADPAAALIGGSVGKTTYDLSGPKSGEGTLAFFIVSLAVLSISLAMLGVYVPLGPIVLASIFCAASEGLLGRGKDNLVLPTVAAFAVSLLV